MYRPVAFVILPLVDGPIRRQFQQQFGVFVFFALLRLVYRTVAHPACNERDIVSFVGWIDDVNVNLYIAASRCLAYCLADRTQAVGYMLQHLGLLMLCNVLGSGVNTVLCSLQIFCQFVVFFRFITGINCVLLLLRTG